MSNKRSIIIIAVGAAAAAAGILSMVYSSAISDRVSKQLDQYLILSDEASVREALDGELQTAVIMNAPLTGDSCEDPMKILKDSYVSLEYDKYVYETRESGNHSYQSDWEMEDSIITKGKNLMIYGDIPLTAEDYRPYSSEILLTDETVLDEYADLVSLEDGDRYCYYPDEIGDWEENVRYEVKGILQGAQTAFLAEIGKGEIRLAALKDGETAPIDGYNSRSTLEYALDERAGSFSLVGMAFLMGAAGLILFGVIDWVSQSARSGKKGKSTQKKDSKGIGNPFG